MGMIFLKDGSAFELVPRELDSDFIKLAGGGGKIS
jgi:hypothetical protein